MCRYASPFLIVTLALLIGCGSEELPQTNQTAPAGTEDGAQEPELFNYENIFQQLLAQNSIKASTRAF